MKRKLVIKKIYFIIIYHGKITTHINLLSFGKYIPMTFHWEEKFLECSCHVPLATFQFQAVYSLLGNPNTQILLQRKYYDKVICIVVADWREREEQEGKRNRKISAFPGDGVIMTLSIFTIENF